MRIRRLWNVFARACLMLAVLLAAASCGTAATPAPVFHGTLAISAPSRATVGTDVPVTVTSTGIASTAPITPEITLVATGSYGTQVYRTTMVAGVAHVAIPGSATRNAGVVALAVVAGTARAETTLELIPGPPTEPITPLVGARSIIADGAHWNMTVVVPFDGYGNPVAEGTAVDIRAQHPDGQVTNEHAEIQHLLAWTRMYSKTRAGRAIISAVVAGKHGSEAEFSEIPGWPANLAVAATPNTVPADGRQLVTLRTPVLRDRFKNVLPDGTLVTFIVANPNGPTQSVPATTIDGVAQTQLQAPQQPGTLTAQATVYGSASSPVAVTFTAYTAAAFPITTQIDNTTGAVVLVAGPILGPLEQYIPDGTPVLFHIIDAVGNAKDLTSAADQGYATVDARLAELAPGHYTVRAIADSATSETTLTIP